MVQFRKIHRFIENTKAYMNSSFVDLVGMVCKLKIIFVETLRFKKNLIYIGGMH